MKIRFFAISGIIAALYFAVSMLIAPFSYGAIQLRVAEMFNHLVVFNKKFIYAILLGVFITNLFSPNGLIDVPFGVAQSLIALLITILCAKFISNKTVLMIINTIVFSFTMSIIAFEIMLVGNLPLFGKEFFLTWGTIALGEFIVLAVGIPVMKILNKRLNFELLLGK